MILLTEQDFYDKGTNPDAMEVFVISVSSKFANKWINVNRGQFFPTHLSSEPLYDT